MGMHVFAWPFIRLILTEQFYGLAFYLHKLVNYFIHLKYTQGTYHILLISLLKGLRPCKGCSGQRKSSGLQPMQTQSRWCSKIAWIWKEARAKSRCLRSSRAGNSWLLYLWYELWLETQMKSDELVALTLCCDTSALLLQLSSSV